MPLTILICPSTPNFPRTDSTSDNGAAGNRAVSDYASDHAVESNLGGAAFSNGITMLAEYSGSARRGALFPHNVTGRNSASLITDGLSSTLFLVEDVGRPQEYRLGHPTTTTTISGGSWADDASDLDLGGSNPTTGVSNSSAGAPPAAGYCALNCTNANEMYSFHLAGCNTLFGDGHVGFLTNATTIDVMAALITCAGSEIVEAP
jgi:prepilin-type processing-associated H-X9-DG protein